MREPRRHVFLPRPGVAHRIIDVDLIRCVQILGESAKLLATAVGDSTRVNGDGATFFHSRGGQTSALLFAFAAVGSLAPPIKGVFNAMTTSNVQYLQNIFVSFLGSGKLGVSVEVIVTTGRRPKNHFFVPVPGVPVFVAATRTPQRWRDGVQSR
jgi:hypothetical protein